ncbi:hypothetical protein CPC08DRAFT_769136 [Agrocybe pediades]|nr:hypothetical protein CPC08DRAFT_769136 [Agrocybe pediades]
MDIRPHYNNSDAAVALESYMLNDDNNALNNIYKNDRKHRGFCVQKFDKPKKWAIVRNDGVAHDKPFTFHLKCAIAAKTFPPFQSCDIPNNSSRYKYLRVGGTFIGFDIPEFQTAVKNMAILHGVLDKAFPEHQLQPWSRCDAFGWTSFDASTRIFTPAHDADRNAYAGMPAEWDPTGKLRAADRGKLWFLRDNCVSFGEFERDSDDKLSTGVRDLSPTAFRIGDIVDVQFAIYAIQVGEQNYKMFLSLQGVYLVDDSFSEDAAITEKLYPVERVLAEQARRRQLAEEDDPEASTRMCIS